MESLMTWRMLGELGLNGLAEGASLGHCLNMTSGIRKSETLGEPSDFPTDGLVQEQLRTGTVRWSR
jgi:hypothetical protein